MRSPAMHPEHERRGSSAGPVWVYEHDGDARVPQVQPAGTGPKSRGHLREAFDHVGPVNESHREKSRLPIVGLRMLKIIAGEFRSRILVSPEDDHTSRPYTGRAKETVFNLLRGWFDDARVLDLFAGVGTMGLEAVSRGASKVLLVERNREIYDLLRRNINALGCGDRAEAMCADALSPLALTRAPRPLDLVFIDPPYDLMQRPASRQRVFEQIARSRDLMGEKGFIVLRSPIAATDEFTVEGFHGPEPHDYGREMHVLLYAPAARTSAGEPIRQHSGPASIEQAPESR